MSLDCDSFLLACDSTGSLQSAISWVGTGKTSFTGVTGGRSGELYIAGRSDNASGGWQTIDRESVSPAGTTSTLALEVVIPEGAEADAQGTETEPEGVVDVGAGGTDVLMMKYDPR